MHRNQFWIMGLLAGIAGGLMAYAGLYAGVGTIFLLLAAPFTVYVASLGWGTAAGLTAAVVATAITGFDGTMAAPVVGGALLFFPAAWAGHLANLARRDTIAGAGAANGREVTVWFPLSGVLLRLMLSLIAGVVITGWVVGYSGDELAEGFLKMMSEYYARQAEFDSPGTEALQRSARLYAGMIPLFIPAVLLFVHVTIIYLAAMVVRLSGRLSRPADDIAATASLPVEALALPAAGLVCMMLFSGSAYAVAAVVAGIGVAGFALVGLAELHHISRGRPGRGFLLFISYFMLVLFTFPLLIFAGMGVRRTIRHRNAPPPT
ncbi:MAG: hypothetical protein VYD64_10240 [Pseudomonadota bacterium]|nr:hypothetical protein [Pseudomonadota bacterium]